MRYQAPLRDIRFILGELADLRGVSALSSFDAISDDLVDAILQENARFVEQEIAPLNRAGDKKPTQRDAGCARHTRLRSRIQGACTSRLARLAQACCCRRHGKP